MRHLLAKRLPVVAGFAIVACGFLSATSVAQERPPSPSAAGPMDLTKPQFDTETPHYDVTAAIRSAPNTVVAEVDGRPITLGQIGDAIRDLPIAIAQRPFDVLFPTTRDELIARQALVVRAHQTGVDEDPDVKRQIQASQDNILAQSYVKRQTASHVTEQMLLAAYNRIYVGKPGVDQVRFRLILVGTEREALDIIKELQGGADFATVAHRSSKDPTAVIGGAVAFVGRDGLTPEIGAVAFALTPGQLAPYPVASGGAWYVIKTEERRRAETPLFATVRESLRFYLQQQDVRAVVKDALDSVTVHEYAISGKEQPARPN